MSAKGKKTGLQLNKKINVVSCFWNFLFEKDEELDDYFIDLSPDKGDDFENICECGLEGSPLRRTYDDFNDTDSDDGLYDIY